MAKLRDALKYLGTKVNGVEPKGHYITDILMSIADDYQGGEPTGKVTLTYALGAYGEGNVPDPVTVDAGTDVNIEFENNIPYREGFVFIGWDTNYEASEPTYTAEGTNTITMTENVTLYPIFANAQTQYLLTYSLGEYGSGRIPNPVRVNEGETVQIDFDPHPSYDGSGKVFAGWATTDGASEATYTEDGTNEITMNADVTLYPVFVAEPVTYTLTYALGYYATGSVPEAVTVDAGETVQINFETVPSYDGVGKVFAGWSTTDGAENPNYTEDGTNTITMNADVTLYPVFAEQGGSYAINVINNSSVGVVINGDGGTVNVSPDGTGGYNYEDNDEVYFSVNENASVSATFTGTFKGSNYTDEPLTILNGSIYVPKSSSINYWGFEDGDGGTLTVTNKVSTRYTLTYALGNDATGSVPSSVTEDEGTTVNIDFSTYPSCVSDPTKEFIGWATTDESSTADYSSDGTTQIILFSNVTLYPVFAAAQPKPSGEYIEIVNNSSEDVEIYYEEDKEEKGNTTVTAGSSETITIDRNYPYYIRYGESSGSGNSHNFDGVYHESAFDNSVTYYDGNVCPPNESTNTDWSFYEGDHGTLTITDGGH